MSMAAGNIFCSAGQSESVWIDKHIMEITGVDGFVPVHGS